MNIIQNKICMLFSPRTPIVSLFFSGCPSAIFWRIVTVIVDPIYRLSGGRMFHVIQKIIKTMTPAITNLNSSSTVINKSFISRAFASFNHSAPNFIKSCLRQSMFLSSLARKFAIKTTARFCISTRNIAHSGMVSLTAIANKYSMCNLISRGLNANQASVSNASIVFSYCHKINDKRIVVICQALLFILILPINSAFAGGFNGSGTYVRYFGWVNDKNNGIDITASRFDTEDNGYATGLSSCIIKDGQQTTTARIPFAVGLSFAGASGVAPTGDLTSGIFSPSSGEIDIKSVGSVVSTFTSTGLNATAIGATTSSTALFSTATAANLYVGTFTGVINNTAIGATTSSTALFSTATIGTLNSATVALTGGTINGTTLGATTSSTALFSTATIGTVHDKGGTIDGTAIGSTTSSTALFSTATATNLNVTGTLTATGLSAGSPASAASFVALNSSNQAVLAAGGALTLITTGTSSSGSFSIGSGSITNAYSTYILMLDGLTSATLGAASLELQLSSNNGANVIATGYLEGGCSSTTTGACGTFTSATTFIDLFGGHSFASSGLQGGSARIYLYSPSQAETHLVDWSIESNSGGSLYYTQGHALQTTSTTINYVKVLSDTSTYAVNYRLYGQQ